MSVLNKILNKTFFVKRDDTFQILHFKQNGDLIIVDEYLLGDNNKLIFSVVDKYGILYLDNDSSSWIITNKDNILELWIIKGDKSTKYTMIEDFSFRNDINFS